MAATDRPNNASTGSSIGSGWLLAGYVGVGGFFIQELILRRPGAASSLNASHDDEGTTRTLLESSALAYVLPLALRRLPLSVMPSAAAATGLIMQACGLALRVWSMRTLGASYTRTLRTAQDQSVVDTGPYRMIRHPGYSGALLMWIGLALSSRSAPATVLVAGLMGRAYQRRITAEENLLLRALPEYGDYSRRTKKLIPLFW
ncbi:MAG: isoprenylcysteine carboxylmethyltransferase family protein [Mycobacterium sp.]|nr:isoprenylcysteine carboxylmethyltransferase family protein [Mycobacterium sp.]